MSGNSIVSQCPNLVTDPSSDSTKAEIEQKLNKTLHDIDVERINLSLFREHEAHIHNLMIKGLNDKLIIMLSLKDLDEGEYLRWKWRYEDVLRRHDAQQKAMADLHNGRIRQLRYRAERLRLEKLNRGHKEASKGC